MKMKTCASLAACVLFVVCSSGALADEAAPNVHNEYHNSTIYNGTPQSAPHVAPPQEEGIFVYRDPDTGDRVVSVRSRLSQDNRTQQQPSMIYVEPRVSPY